MRFHFVLPLPRFVLHPLASVAVCIVHLYLAAGHLGELAAGNIEWTHVWKGFGALAGAYVFAALASRRMAARSNRHCTTTTQTRMAGVIGVRNDWKVIFLLTSNNAPC